MSVSAVSSYTYSSTYQYKFFRSVVSASQLQALFEKYGITPTGDSYNDLQALYNAMYPEAEAQVLGVSAGQQVQTNLESSRTADVITNTNVPWANLMSQVGLEATGDFAVDYEAFNNKILSMQSSAASSPQAQANISQLMAQASIVFVQPTNSSSETINQAETSSQMLLGADIQAQINKMFFLG